MKCILIVDDNPANIGLLFDCLNHEGYKTLVAQDGKSAVQTAARTHPDLILLDVIMPGMDGSETFDRIRSISPETKVLLSSGYALDGQADREDVDDVLL